MKVEASLTRPGGVYLAGESVSVEVVVTGEEGGGRLAWCSVQLHCQEQRNLFRVKAEESGDGRTETDRGDTSFAPAKGEGGSSVFASRPSILFCDLELPPGQRRVFHHSETLPADDLPPSFRGHAVKYLYKMTVGLQDLHRPVRLLRLPLRVLVLSGLSHVCLDDASSQPRQPIPTLSPPPPPRFSTSPHRSSTTSLPYSNTQLYNVTTSRGKRRSAHRPSQLLQARRRRHRDSWTSPRQPSPVLSSVHRCEMVEEVAEEVTRSTRPARPLLTCRRQAASAHCLSTSPGSNSASPSPPLPLPPSSPAFCTSDGACTSSS